MADRSETSADVAPLGVPPGVVWQARPPATISSQLVAAVERAVAAIPPDRSGALIGVATERGMNVVVAGRSPDGTLHAQAWVGKSGWDRPLREGWEVGAQLLVVF